MSAKISFSQAEISTRAPPLLSVDQKIREVFEGPPQQAPIGPPIERANASLDGLIRLEQENLLLLERINMLEAENLNLRLTVQFYQDLCLDDFA